ncbi:MAG: hypothetical protein OSB62_01965 [Alphaproteobacteria bacterium]|nr:hypothetical protein [Alphaproteobacteria bacterium]
MKPWMFILSAAAILLFMAGIPIGTIILFLGVIIFTWFGINKLGQAEQKAKNDSFDGQTIKEHTDNWENRIRHYLPEGTQGHTQTNVKTYGGCGTAIYPIFKQKSGDEIVGYQVDFLLFDLQQKTTHTNRYGRLSFLNDEIEDAVDVAYHFWEKIDEMTEKLSAEPSKNEARKIFDSIGEIFVDMDKQLNPENYEEDAPEAD